MAFTAMTAPDVGDSTKASEVQDLIANDAFLYERSGESSGLGNPSFELLDGNSEPIGWTVAVAGATPGTWGVEDVLNDSAAVVIHGKRAIRMTANGAGGYCTLTSDSFLLETLNQAGSLCVKADITTATRFRATLTLYDPLGTLVETVALIDCDILADLQWQSISLGATPTDYTYATYGVLTIIWGESGNTTDGTLYLDGPIIPDMGLDETVYSGSGTYTGFVEAFSFYAFIAPDTTDMRVDLRMRGDGGGGSYYVRVTSALTTTTEMTSLSAGFSEKTATVAVNAGDKGKYVRFGVEVASTTGVPVYFYFGAPTAGVDAQFGVTFRP